MLATRPIVSVTPKPCTGPRPISTRMTDESSAVTCESKMVQNERE